jgi:hypothetical protein
MKDRHDDEGDLDQAENRSMSALIDDFQVPVCVYCKRGTTPQRLVQTWYNYRVRRTYHAHPKCVDVHEGKPIPRDPPENHSRSSPNPAERLA